MENEKRYFRVGLFMLSIITLSIFIFMWFSDNRATNQYIRYAIYFDESVTGLSIGSPVKLKGIDVGTVESISFDAYHNDRILVLVDIVDTAPVRRNTVASLSIQGITGTSYVSLNNTGADPEFFSKLPDEEYLVIKSKPSNFEQFFDGLPALVNQFSKLGKQGALLLSDDNIKRVEQSVLEFQHLMGETKTTLRELRLLTNSVRQDPSIVIHKPQYEGYEIK